MNHTIKFVDRLLLKGRNLQQLGIDSKALPIFESLSRFHSIPKNVTHEARDRMTQLYRKQKNYRLARRALAKTAHQHPDSADLHYKMARLIEKDYHCDPKRAKVHFLRALRLEPKNSRYLSGFGMYSIHFGCRDRGLRALRKAYRLDPDNALVMKRYIKVLQQLHLLKEARRVLLASRFRLGKHEWFQQLFNEHQHTVIRLRQKKNRQTEPLETVSPRILPFLPKTDSDPATKEIEGYRIDGPDVLPAPHLPLRLRRPDQRHAQ